MSDWRARAEHELIKLADSGQEFTADDLIERVGPPDPGHAPNSANSAVGSLFRRAASLGHITAVGTKQSSQPHRKGGLIRVWQGGRR